MNKRNRILAGLALSGAAVATALGAAPAQAATPALDQVADIGQPGGLFGTAAFLVTGTLTGVEPKVPSPQAIVDDAKKQKAEQDAHAAGH
ncbi:hypothetical protein [Kitasatospora cinereorecta]|uniref:Secreted protein n=1 Tax=Kitasatospora cinereorecta TaxID=285560 RepID=A0ABW0VJJ3_9ACTN